MEQVKVNCQEEIQHPKTGWAVSNLEYERTPPYHIQNLFYACCGQTLPKV